MDDLEFIKQIKAGNEQAFKQLVEVYKDMVINTCYGFLQNREDAEDVAQEVFIKVYRSVASFREESRLSTWLYRVAVNESLNLRKKRKRKKWLRSFQSFSNDSSDTEEWIDEKGPDPHEALEQKERARILHKAIEKLSENQRIAFTLNKYENLSYKDIAEVMGTTVSAVESLLDRAKKNLRKKLTNYYQR